MEYPIIEHSYVPTMTSSSIYLFLTQIPERMKRRGVLNTSRDPDMIAAAKSRVERTTFRLCMLCFNVGFLFGVDA